MHAFLSLATMLALAPHGSGTHVVGPSATAPKIAVLPLVVEGTLPDVWRQEADARLRDGLERGAVSVQQLSASTCVSPDCAGGQALAAGADFGVWAKLTVASNQRDYSLVIKAVGADTSNVVGTVTGSCDLCGFEEAVAMVEAKAASVPAAIERLGATNPIVAFTSTPGGVEIAVDGVSAGATPLELPLSPGKHRVMGTKPGYEPQTFELEAVEGVRKELSFALVAAPIERGLSEPEDAQTRATNARPLIISGAVLTS
ncbi:MAG: PEGA domain-containing protein, partial [Myxococcota bacterium]